MANLNTASTPWITPYFGEAAEMKRAGSSIVWGSSTATAAYSDGQDGEN
jgi:hypothetical protein